MRKLFFIALFSLLLVVPFVSALPDAPPLVWFTGNENPPFDNNGVFTVNWDPVTNEEILRYNIYLNYASGGNPILVGSNTTPTTFLFSGSSGGNYTFKVTAVNTINEEGLGTISDWVFVHTSRPLINYAPPTPENNAYTKENWTTISGNVLDSYIDTTIINWNGADNIYRHASGILWMYTFEMPTPGKYTYYVWANNSATNFIKGDVRSIIYDITKPSLSIISPVQDAVYDSVSISLDYVASDAAPITCSYEYNSINTTIFGCENITFLPIYNNKTTITIWVSDAAGNMNSASAVFTANTPSAPKIISTVPENNKMLVAPLLSGKFNDVISIKTDKQANCRYSTTPNTSFESMANYFIAAENNTHNTTVSLSDKTTYLFYIRCKSLDNAINTDDYLLQFSTADSNGLVIIDPNSTVLKNNVLHIKTIKDKPTVVKVPLKTRALYNVYGVTAKVPDDVAMSIQAKAPVMISNSEASYLTIYAFPSVSGVLKTNITLSLSTYSSTFLVEVTTYYDFYPEFDAVDLAIPNISSQIQNLSLKGVDVTKYNVELERMKSDISDIYSIYSSENPAEAREKFLQLNDSFNLLNADIMSAQRKADESNSLLGSISDSDKGDSDSGGGISLSVIVIVIILVIVVIIIATSYMPDNDDKDALADAPPTTPDNPGV
ncbi:MAG: fibronectin type III domain-containing protein [Nanoarchaeota archaeon]|nr:fibronectin type III domain-containing protein [Nanoarchaeota archaeon]MBU4451321.1 fibronectin type III domain-containing protein [Nanoarchaeota archaeon]MCG2723282.1 fibronectin type III domain-containing protein [archaeon]